jgi:mycothiol system anti-sigma-R factor
MSPCEDFDSRLLLYLDNALNPQEAEHMRAHLQTCANCRARLEEEQELSRLLKRSRPLYSAPQQLRARVSAIERESASIPTRTARRNWWHGDRGLRTGKCRYTLTLAIALALVPDVAQKVRASSYVEQDHRLAAAVVLYMKGNAVRLEHIGSPFFRYAAFEAVPRERGLEVSPPREC